MLIDTNTLIVSVTDDNERPDICEAGTYTGIVIAKRPRQKKVLFIYDETSKTEFSWIELHGGNRGFDKTFTAPVT